MGLLLWRARAPAARAGLFLSFLGRRFQRMAFSKGIPPLVFFPTWSSGLLLRAAQVLSSD